MFYAKQKLTRMRTWRIFAEPVTYIKTTGKNKTWYQVVVKWIQLYLASYNMQMLLNCYFRAVYSNSNEVAKWHPVL